MGMVIIPTGSVRSTLISSCLSFAATQLAAKKLAITGTLLSSFMSLPHNQAASVITQTFISHMLPISVQQQQAAVQKLPGAPKASLASAPKKETADAAPARQ